MPENEKASRGRIAVVDDDDAMLFSLSRILGHYGFEIKPFASSAKALQAFKESPSSFDAILSDLNMPNLDGLTLMERIREVDKDAVIIILTGFPSTSNAVSALRRGAFDFLEKPYSNETLSLTLDTAVELRRLRRDREGAQAETKKMLDLLRSDLKIALKKLDDSYLKSAEILLALLELKEPDTAKRDARISAKALVLASALALPPKEREALRRGALLQNIGKLGLPDSVLNRGDALSEDEMKTMRRHPELGFALASEIPEMEAASEIILSHHERFDGKGYPRKLKGEDICLGARILSVVEAYDSLRNPRAGERTRSKDEALVEIEKSAGMKFDPSVAEALKERVDEVDKA